MSRRTLIIHLVLLPFILLASCRDTAQTAGRAVDSAKPVVHPPSRPEIQRLVIGTFYGECGRHCALMYVVDSSGIAADTSDGFFEWSHFSEDRRGYPLKNLLRLQNVPDSIRSAIAALPLTILDTLPTTIGCPDCSDGGGLFVQINREGKERYWFIDLQEHPHELDTMISRSEAIIGFLRRRAFSGRAD